MLRFAEFFSHSHNGVNVPKHKAHMKFQAQQNRSLKSQEDFLHGTQPTKSTPQELLETDLLKRKNMCYWFQKQLLKNLNRMVLFSDETASTLNGVIG